MSIRALFLRFSAGLLQLLSGIALSALLIMTLLERAGHGNTGPCAPDASIRSSSTLRFVDWLTRLSGHLEALDWSCQPLNTLIGAGWSSVKLAGLALLLCFLSGALHLWGRIRVMDSLRPMSAFFSAWLISPTVLWAALLTVLTNATVLALDARWPQLPEALWLFPSPRLELRYAAALLVLSFGGGTLWHLYEGLRLDLQSLLESENIEMARANGWSVSIPLARQLAPMALTRLVGRLPLLLGEVIVIEYVFALDGSGRSLLVAVNARDEAALLTLTAFLVAISLVGRLIVDLVGTAVLPGNLERAADVSRTVRGAA